MDLNLSDKLSRFIDKHSTLDAFSFYFLGICHGSASKSESLDTLFLQLKTYFQVLSKESIIKQIHETKSKEPPAINSSQYPQSVVTFLKQEENLNYLFKDFEILPLLFSRLSKSQWFYLGTFMARNPKFELRAFLRTFYTDFLAYTLKHKGDQVQVDFLASLAQGERKPQIKKEEKGSKENLPVSLKKPECPICLDLISRWSKKAKLSQCQHSFHFKCFEKYLQIMINEKAFPLRCAVDGCFAELPEFEIMKNSSKTYQKKFHSFTLKSFVETHGNEIFCCPSPNCEYFEFLEISECKYFYCRKCKKNCCMECRKDWHGNMSCEQSEQVNFSKVASKHGYHRCPSCQMYVEKNGGCRRMFCHCKKSFNWDE